MKEEMVDYLEERVDDYTAETPDIERFILPGGTKPSATIHIARTITRRAERLVVSLMKQEENIPPVTLQYLNRLSDYFFDLQSLIIIGLVLLVLDELEVVKFFGEGGGRDRKNTKMI